MDQVIFPTEMDLGSSHIAVGIFPQISVHRISKSAQALIATGLSSEASPSQTVTREAKL
jgi:hypothetical protein